jgi:hypothetical protein
MDERFTTRNLRNRRWCENFTGGQRNIDQRSGHLRSDAEEGNSKGGREMKRILLALCLMVSLAAAMPASADTLYLSGLDSLVYGQAQYAGEFVGPLGASLGSAIPGGVNCLDINTVTYVPGSFEVYIGTLSPVVDLSQAKFATHPTYTTAELFHYQEAAALLGEMPSHTDEIGPISFAIWRIFDPNHAPGADPTKEQFWMDWAANINVNNYDFSSVRIYTPFPNPATNQEFMSGTGSHVPLPPSVLLLGSGLIGLGLLRREWSLKK